jgi:hypothetical protein
VRASVSNQALVFLTQHGGPEKTQVEVELTTISSNYHVELTPSDAGLKDRYVVQELIKEMAKSRPLDVASFVAGGQQQGGGGSSNTGERWDTGDDASRVALPNHPSHRRCACELGTTFQQRA